MNGNWGEGKTTFVKMWQGMLKEKEVPNIYIDAFSNDFIDDAFLTIASAISNYAKNNIQNNKKKVFNEFIEKTKKVGKRLLSLTTRIGIKAATLGAIKDADFDEFNKIKDELTSELSDIAGNYIEDILDSHSENIALIESYRELLSKLPSMLKDNKDKPLVIIIDELDRCKPTFAVEILEKIKHLYSVEKVIFVLVMNREQLEESIKCVYGQNIDAHTYLQKFINIEATLPKRLKDLHGNDQRIYSLKLLEEHDLRDWAETDGFLDDLCIFSYHFNLSLRQLEKVFTNLSIIYSTLNEKSLRIASIIVFVCVIRVVNPKLFEKLLDVNTSFEEVSKEIKLDNINYDKDRNDRMGEIVKFLHVALISQKKLDSLDKDNEIKILSLDLKRGHINRERIIPNYAERLNLIRLK